MCEKNPQIARPHPKGVASRTLISLPSNYADRDITASANSSAARLAKRLLHPPPAVSDMTLPSSAAKEGHEYPKGWKLASITLALCCAVFVGTLDQTIVATAIPAITDQFNSLQDQNWYGSAYLLTMAAFQLPFGKLYSTLSVKWTFLSAIVIFEAGSLLCGAAPSSAALIAGRAVAGVGAAAILSGTLIIAAHTMPLEYRPIYTGAVGALSGIAAIVGPVLGGALTDSAATWRWCFYINLPLGAITILFIVFLTPNFTPRATSSLTYHGETNGFRTPSSVWASLSRFDFYGMITAIAAIVCCLLALQWGGTTYAWDSARIVSLFTLSGILLCAVIVIQIRKGDEAMLPPRIMKNRSILGATGFMMAMGACYFVVIYYLPIWFQAVQGATAIESGVKNLAMILPVVIFAMVAGGIITTWGYYVPFMIACAAITAVGSGLLTLLKVNSAARKWIGYQIIFGVGLGLGMQQPLIAVQACLGTEDVATGTAIVVFAQTIGGSIFLLAAQSVFNNRLLLNLAKYAPDVNAGLVSSVGVTGLANAVSAGQRAGVLDALSEAVTTTLYIPTAMAAVAIIAALSMEWKSVKGRKFSLSE